MAATNITKKELSNHNSGNGWSSNGISGQGKKPFACDVVKENGPYRLLVFGTARCLWEDRRAAIELIENKTHHVMTINDAAIHVMGHPIDHIVSLHKEFLGPFKKIKMAARNLGESTTHCDKEGAGVQCVWKFFNVGGTSALFAAKIGIAMGYKKIILCGCPMDNSGHYWEDPSTVGILGCEAIGMVWKDAARDYLRNYVKSMSGRTKECLGEPTKEWLDDKSEITQEQTESMRREQREGHILEAHR